jgi:glycosyltransferase involved in cell wall biosynthesis
MNILMLSNTYLPHVGGVARSVEAFSREYRARGHRVLIVAPAFNGTRGDGADVIRVPAIQKFNGSDFSVRLPIPGFLMATLQDFRPDIVHSHHPFLLGDTALRIAAAFNVPLVFQHHTMYEQYTHYVPGDSPALKRFVIDLSTGYASLCDQVFAPSESVAAVLRNRGVETPISVVPTGVDTGRFVRGDGASIRAEQGIPPDAFVVGHVGRLAPEKNLPFLAEAVARFLDKHVQARFLLVGDGPSVEEVRRIFTRHGLLNRLHLAGVLEGQALVHAYHAMDVFAFASRSETQGIVLVEAMAAGRPVVGLDAPGVREVIQDWYNGRLLYGQRADEFAAALDWVAERDEARRTPLREAALQTADRFAMPRCAERALSLYESLLGSEGAAKKGAEGWEGTLWHTALRRIEAEWDLITTRTQAASTAVLGRKPRFRWLRWPLRLLARLFSRTRWLLRIVGRRPSPEVARRTPLPEKVAEPGLLLVQIDGLSRSQLERALRRGRLPWLRRLIRRKHYRLHTFYSGIPSSTPAVQGELFYGTKGAVPAFAFADRKTGRIIRMYEREAAAEVQSRLATRGQPLLGDGSAYADIYSGGAAESHYCASTTGWGELTRTMNPLSWAFMFLLHFWTTVRIVVLLALESILAVVDCFRGLFRGRDLWKELQFVPVRVSVCVLLRELVTSGAAMDAARGLPVVHVNFLGYDEQAHRRGPASAFAHWSLRGIDDAMRRIWKVARRSDHRNYQIWVYSDHGQERVLPYHDIAGRTIQESVAEVLGEVAGSAGGATDSRRTGIQYHRSRWLGGGRWLGMLLGKFSPSRARQEEIEDRGLVAAIGPIGHVYPPRQLTADQRDRVARRLVAEAKIPLVLAAVREDQSEADAWTEKGRFRLPRDAPEVLGADHPFLDEVARDLVATCHHPDAGDLVISGWNPRGRPTSFPREHGAHGGPGREETRGFALLPGNAALPASHGVCLRPLELRAAVFQALRGSPPMPEDRRSQPRKAASAEEDVPRPLQHA